MKGKSLSTEQIHTNSSAVLVLVKNEMRRLSSTIRLLALPAIVMFAIYDIHYSDETIDVDTAPRYEDRPTPYFIQMGPERVLMCNTSFHVS